MSDGSPLKRRELVINLHLEEIVSTRFSGKVPALCALVVAMVLFIGVLDAHAWWDNKWKYRRKIKIDASATGADLKESLTDVPVLIRLHTGNFTFSNAKEDGSDIRFVTGDDKTPLKFHKEAYDQAAEVALFWVKVPRLAAASNADFLWLYYGNGSAVPADEPGGTYDVNQVIVYHLGESEGPPKDATAYANNASGSTGMTNPDSIIGNGLSFKGVGAKMVIPLSPSLKFPNGFAFSTWIRMAEPQKDARLLSWLDEKRGLEVVIDQNKVFCRAKSGEQTVETDKNVELSPGVWHHLAVMAEPSKKLSVLVDGAEAASLALPFGMPEPESDMMIGADASGNHPFAGDLDEIEISNKPRPTGWMMAAFKSQGLDEALTAAGEEEGNSSTGGIEFLYLGTIVKNLTLDGWIIIFFLFTFSVIAWLVFLRKAFTFRLIDKGNDSFTESFSDSKDLISLDGDTGEFENSPAYRVYQAGCRELKSRLGDSSGTDAEGTLSAKAIRAFDAALQKAYTEENRKLNSQMVILAMAISGPPFIGLLGTVWGVMTTFAAMAEAGEANLQAIAPGVASALSATVCGLLVAIPALFKYNYLVSRMKNIAATVSAFMGEFSAKVDHMYGKD